MPKKVTLVENLGKELFDFSEFFNFLKYNEEDEILLEDVDEKLKEIQVFISTQLSKVRAIEEGNNG